MKQICSVQCCKEENLIICISHKFFFRLPPHNYADCSQFIAYTQKSCIYHFISSPNIVRYFKCPLIPVVLKKKSQDTPLIKSPIKNWALSRTVEFTHYKRKCYRIIVAGCALHCSTCIHGTGISSVYSLLHFLSTYHEF